MNEYVSLPDLAAELNIKPWRLQTIVKNLELEYITVPNGRAGRPPRHISRDDIPKVQSMIFTSKEEAQNIIKRARALPGWNNARIAVLLDVNFSSVYNWSIARNGMPQRHYHEIEKLLEVE